jgi:thiosulfate/3-mercaptopyruvate sulfurtransferase
MIAPLVSVDWLASHCDDPRVRIVDTRWYLLEPQRGAAEYGGSHIPGAVYLDVATDLSGPPGSGPGRHPLPDADAFAATASRVGIGADVHVVAYDLPGGMAATRLWWLLRAYGHAAVSILDGGWQAWCAAGFPTSDQPVAPPRAVFVPRWRDGLTIDADGVAQACAAPGTLLLDSRAAERYAGRVEPLDSRAGHIPGARSAHFSGDVATDGRLKPAAALAARYAALGVADATQVICYCGSGVSATHTVFALHLLGRDALLYPGSWSDWSSDPARPIATGDEP